MLKKTTLNKMGKIFDNEDIYFVPPVQIFNNENQLIAHFLIEDGLYMTHTYEGHKKLRYKKMKEIAFQYRVKLDGRNYYYNSHKEIWYKQAKLGRYEQHNHFLKW